MVGACVKENSELEGSCLLAPSCEYKGGFLNMASEFVGPPWLFPCSKRRIRLWVVPV